MAKSAPRITTATLDQLRETMIRVNQLPPGTEPNVTELLEGLQLSPTPMGYAEAIRSLTSWDNKTKRKLPREGSAHILPPQRVEGVKNIGTEKGPLIPQLADGVVIVGSSKSAKMRGRAVARPTELEGIRHS